MLYPAELRALSFCYVIIFIVKRQGVCKLPNTHKGLTIAIITTLCLGAVTVTYAKLSGSLVPEAIVERLTPVGKVDVEGAKPQAAIEQVSGPAKIYKTNCAMCHDSGLAGAPKKANKGDWAPRHAKGWDNMLNKAMNGYRAMPPKGNCLKCSEEDIRKTIEFMTEGLF
jgi:cytochrome c5